MSFLDNLLGNKISKEAEVSQGTDATDHFERKVKAHDWIKSVSELDADQVEKEYNDKLAQEAKLLGKTAAYEIGDTMDETIKKDYERDVKILSDYSLAEMLAEYRGQVENNLLEKFSELKEKAKADVASGREKCETELLKLVGTHTALDWKKKFAEFSKDAKVEQPTDKDLYEPKVTDKEHDFSKPSEDKFKVPSEDKKADVMIGVGREEKERTEATKEAGVLQESITEGLGKVASTIKKADYQGWKNSETWQAALWLDNDRGMYETIVEMIPQYQEAYQLGDAIKALVEEQKPDLGATLWEDMLTWALSNVDWREIAEHEMSKVAEASKLPKVEKVADKVKDSPANDTGNLAMPEGKKSAGDKPEEAVDGTTLPADDKALGSKSDQAAEANSPEKGDKAKDIESVNKEAAKPSQEELMREMTHVKQNLAKDPEKKREEIEKFKQELHTEADMCPVCAGKGTDLKNYMKDNMHCNDCGITYSSKEIKSCASKADVIKKVAEIQSPWIVTKDENGQEVIARRDISELNKESEEDKTEELQK